MKFDVVEAGINSVAYSHSRSKQTASHYIRYLDKFCTFIGCTPQQILDDYERMRDREFKRKYAQYLRAFISSGSQNGYAPGSLRYMAGVVKSFFKYNDLPLGFVPFAPDKITYHNRDITKEEIEKILLISKPRERAFYAMMVQSGLRPSTLGQLRREHIDPDFSEGSIPCQVVVPAELSKGKFGSYWSWVGSETVKYLRAYFEGSRKNSVGTGDFLFTSEGSDKPLNEKAMTRIFKEHIERLKAKGLIDFEQKEPGKPRSLRLYTLRKYFRRQAVKPRANNMVQYVNFWMGHKVTYNAPHIPSSDEHYFSRNSEAVKYHRELYRQAMPYLQLESKTPDEFAQTILDLRKQLANRDERLKALEKRIRFGYAKSDPKSLMELLTVLHAINPQMFPEMTADKVHALYERVRKLPQVVIELNPNGTISSIKKRKEPKGQNQSDS